MTESALTATSRPRKIPRWLKRTTKVLLILTVIAYIGFCITLYCVQDRLIFRGHLRQGTDITRLTPAAGAQLVTLRAPDGSPLAGLFGPAHFADDSPDPDYAQKPTVLFFYGNSACMNFATKY